MLKVTVHQICKTYVIVKKITYNPIYPQYITILKENIPECYIQIGYIGYAIPIGDNHYKFYGY